MKNFSTMPLHCLLLCFFLSVETSTGLYLTNCTTEKQHLFIVNFGEGLTRQEDNFLKAFFKRFESNRDDDFQRVTVTCIKYNEDQITCLEGYTGKLPDFKFASNISCIPDHLTNLIRKKPSVSVVFGTKSKTINKTFFVDIVLSSKHTFIVSGDDNLYKRNRMVHGVSWIDNPSVKKLNLTLICTDCKPGWVSFEDPSTKTILSCYRARKLNHTEVTMEEAASKCEVVGGNLVSIETDAEFEFLQDFLNTSLGVLGEGCGLEDNSVCLALNLRRDKGHYRWGQGQPIVLSPPWSASLDKKGDCVTWVWSRGQRGVWRHVECNVSDRYVVICEAERITTINHNNTTMGPEFVEYDSDVVSVAFHIEEEKFLTWYKSAWLDYRPFQCSAIDKPSKSIAYSFVCDDKLDCPNGRDEECDMGNKNGSGSRDPTPENVIKSNVKIQPQFDPQLLHELCTSQPRDCGVLQDELNDTKVEHDRRPLCTLWPDIVTCTESPVANKTIGSDHATPYDVAPKCLYVKSDHGAVCGCRSMTHLQNCTTYKCPSGYTKCPLSYCIPEAYVKDRTQDCPHGEDESVRFKCFNTSQRLFLHKVCDGFKDCPGGDDEMNCHVECSNGVTCIAGAAFVSDLYFFSMGKPKYSSVIHNSLRLFNFPSQRLPTDVISVTFNMINRESKLIELNAAEMKIRSDNLSFLTISDENMILYANFRDNSFKEITPTGTFSKLKRLKKLDLSYNTDLTNFTLLLPSLEYLDLSYTSISRLDRKIFENMRRLKVLKLQNTKLTNLNFIPDGFTLKTLNIIGTDMKDIGTNYFNNLQVTGVVKTSNDKLCCPRSLGPNIPAEKCRAIGNKISSCSDLVGDDGKRIFLWAIGLFAVGGNLFALVYRLVWERRVLKTVYGQFVSNLCISDMIMGFYLIIIGVADEVYRDDYFAREDEWQYGVVCQVAGFLSTLSTEVTTFFICLITLDRFLKLRFQTGKYGFTTKTKHTSIVISWLLGFALALVPVLYPERGIFRSNSMCLAFPLDAIPSYGRYYSIALFLGLNFVLYLLIIFGQSFIFLSLSKRRSLSSFSNVANLRRDRDLLVSRLLSLIAISNFIAWVPLQVMGVLILAGVEIDRDAYGWTAVLVLPLNSALKPLLYSFPKLYIFFLSLRNSCRMK